MYILERLYWKYVEAGLQQGKTGGSEQVIEIVQMRDGEKLNSYKGNENGETSYWTNVGHLH